MAEIRTLPAIATKARAYVRRGARVLDAKLPGWWDKLDLEGFDISTGSYCVIGQLAHTDMEAFYHQVGKVMGTGDYNWGLDVLSGIDTRIPWVHGGHFTQEERALYEARIADRNRWAAQHGFEADVLVSYADLQEAWIEAIAVRRGTTRDALWALRAYPTLDRDADGWTEETAE